LAVSILKMNLWSGKIDFSLETVAFIESVNKILNCFWIALILLEKPKKQYMR